MALYRCAACGSPNVITDTQTGGISYNYAKGVVGTAILGAGGAVAGLESKITGVFKCKDCGITLTYPMPNEIKMAIDLGVRDPKSRNNLKSPSGIRLDWNFLRTKYKNIEDGFADAFKNDIDGFVKSFNATKEFYDRILAFDDELVPHLNKHQAEWEQSVKEQEEAKKKEFEAIDEKVAAEIEETCKELEAKLASELSAVSDKIASLKKEQEEAEKQLSALSAFKIFARKQLKDTIEATTNKINQLNEKTQKLHNQHTIDIDNARLSKAQKIKLAVQELDEKYPVPDSPVDLHKKVEVFKKLRNEKLGPVDVYMLRGDEYIFSQSSYIVPLILLAYRDRFGEDFQFGGSQEINCNWLEDVLLKLSLISLPFEDSFHAKQFVDRNTELAWNLGLLTYTVCAGVKTFSFNENALNLF